MERNWRWDWWKGKVGYKKIKNFDSVTVLLIVILKVLLI